MESMSLGYSPGRVLQFNLGYFNSAVRKTNITSRGEMQDMVKQKMNTTPDNIGTYAGRMKINDQFNKSPLDRFIDMFV